MGDLRHGFHELPLEQLTRAEWEALCDGCGRCCLHKIEDEDTGEIADTNVACKLLDTETAQCCDYRNRKAFVPDCLRLTLAIVAAAERIETGDQVLGEGRVRRHVGARTRGGRAPGPR